MIVTSFNSGKGYSGGGFQHIIHGTSWWFEFCANFGGFTKGELLGKASKNLRCQLNRVFGKTLTHFEANKKPIYSFA